MNTRAVRLTIEELGLDLTALAASEDAVARMPQRARSDRLDRLMVEAGAILRCAIERMVLYDGRGYRLAGIVGLFSGGNDSTVTCHLLRHLGLLTHLGHANTGVGVEQTRQYVRDTAAGWGVPLLERKARNPDDAYDVQVMRAGFPGAARHAIMQQRLKEHALRQVRAALVDNPRHERVVFVAGRRRTESQQRTNVPELERIGSVVWVSPLVNWTKLDMNTYRLRYRDVPRNQVADLCHMSAECLCGSYARPGERQEIAQWYPQAFDGIAELERRLAGPEGAHLPAHARTWGWEHDPDVIKPKRRARRASSDGASNLCSSCEARGPHDLDGHLPAVRT